MSARFFVHAKGFTDPAAYVVLSEGEVTLVLKDGAIKDKSTVTEKECLDRAADGAWKEITCDEASSLLSYEHETKAEPVHQPTSRLERELWLDQRQEVKSFNTVHRMKLSDAWDDMTAAGQRKAMTAAQHALDKHRLALKIQFERFPDAW